jgi:hypothetical protein
MDASSKPSTTSALVKVRILELSPSIIIQERQKKISDKHIFNHS